MLIDSPRNTAFRYTFPHSLFAIPHSLSLMSTIEPSRLKEVLNAETFRLLTADNFAILAEEIAKRVATYQNGSPTMIIGPHTSPLLL